MSADRTEPRPSTRAAPPAVSPAVGDPRSTGEIVRDLLNGVQTLLQQQIELAKIELTEALTARVQAVVFALIGAIFGLFALGFLGVTIAVALTGVVADWLAWLIVFAGYLLIAIVALLVARSRVTSPPLAPERTQRSIEETKTWATQQLQR